MQTPDSPISHSSWTLSASAVVLQFVVCFYSVHCTHYNSISLLMVYEGEGVGMILGLELIREERQVGGMAKMGVDNVAAIITTHAIKPEPSHHKWD